VQALLRLGGSLVICEGEGYTLNLALAFKIHTRKAACASDARLTAFASGDACTPRGGTRSLGSPLLPASALRSLAFRVRTLPTSPPAHAAKCACVRAHCAHCALATLARLSTLSLRPLAVPFYSVSLSAVRALLLHFFSRRLGAPTCNLATLGAFTPNLAGMSVLALASLLPC
jgi:hypothetical protein